MQESALAIMSNEVATENRRGIRVPQDRTKTVSVSVREGAQPLTFVGAGQLHDSSESGLGIILHVSLRLGMVIALSNRFIHYSGIVRHATRTESGYLIGIELTGKTVR